MVAEYVRARSSLGKVGAFAVGDEGQLVVTGDVHGRRGRSEIERHPSVCRPGRSSEPLRDRDIPIFAGAEPVVTLERARQLEPTFCVGGQHGARLADHRGFRSGSGQASQRRVHDGRQRALALIRDDPDEAAAGGGVTVDGDVADSGAPQPQRPHVTKRTERRRTAVMVSSTLRYTAPDGRGARRSVGYLWDSKEPAKTVRDGMAMAVSDSARGFAILDSEPAAECGLTRLLFIEGPLPTS